MDNINGQNLGENVHRCELVPQTHNKQDNSAVDKQLTFEEQLIECAKNEKNFDLEDVANRTTIKQYQDVRAWFNHPEYHFNHEDALEKVKGTNDPILLSRKFDEIDRRIERLVKVRMIPYYRKEVTGLNHCVVGVCSLSEWKEYISWKCHLVEPSKKPKRRLKLPSFDLDNSMRYKLRKVEWTSGNIPPLGHKKVWWYFKWKSDSYLFRSFLSTFTLCYNDFLDTVNIEFQYRTHFYHSESKSWSTI